MSRNQSFGELPIGFRKRSRIPTQKTSRLIKEQNKNTIKDGGSTALDAAFTVDTVDTVNMVYNVDIVNSIDIVYTFDTVYTVDTVYAVM